MGRNRNHFKMSPTNEGFKLQGLVLKLEQEGKNAETNI